jgi:hypothetical protein
VPRVGKTDKWQERKKKNGSGKVCGRKEIMAGTVKKNFEAGRKYRSK